MSSYSNYTTNPWIERIHAANKYYDAWESKFDCKKLNQYYENFQWTGMYDAPRINYKPYTLNLVHSTIKIKMANFLFQKPSFVVNPTAGNSHWDQGFAVQSAQIKQDVLNTISGNPNMEFPTIIKRAALDSFFWFGIIETGYAADWRNPLKEADYLNKWDDPDVEDDDLKIKEKNEVPYNERVYVKRIKPWRFRVSPDDKEQLSQHCWFGYWEMYEWETLKKTPGIKLPKDYDGYGSLTDGSNYSRDTSTGLFIPNQYTTGRRFCKVWHIWDQIEKKRKLILDGYDEDGYEIWSKDTNDHPFTTISWDIRVEGFYPIPPVFYWLSSQNEINESREQIRSYRRRFTRKFQYVSGQIDEDEIEKFATGPDGVLIKVNQADAIKAIDNPEIGPTSEGALIQAKDDFNTVSGTSAEARGQDSDRETATQAKILDQRATIRESAEQLDFSSFVGEVGRKLLIVAQQNLTDGLWYQYTANPGQGVMTDMQVVQPVYKWISAQQLDDGYDFTVNVDVKNSTPAAMEQEKAAFTGFVAFVTQFPAVAMSPTLIREAAYRFGYKNEQVIQQMQQAAIASLAAKSAQAGANGQQIMGAANAGAGGNANNTLQSQMQIPGPAQISDQLNTQLS